MTSNAPPGPDELPSLYVRALDATRRYVAGLRDDQWERPTPCAEWNVRQLLQHVVYGTVRVPDIFAGKTLAEVGGRFDGDLLGGDLLGGGPLAAYDAAVALAKPAILAPGAMEQACHISGGDVTGAQYATSMFNDVFIHGWDIAVATGQDATLDPELAEASYRIALPRKGQPRVGTAFGPEIEVVGGADLQTQLLAILGRQA